MKKNIEQAYFEKKKSRLILNIVFGILTAGGVALFAFVWGGGPIGFPLMLIGIFGLIFNNSGRVTDKDFDRRMKDRLDDELAVEQPDYAAVAYDPSSAYCKIGKDKQIRTDVLCQTNIYRTKSTLRVVSKRALMNADKCEVRELEAPLNEIFIRIEEALEPRTNKVCHTMTVEAADGQSIAFPVTSDYATEQFAEEVNQRSGFTKEKEKQGRSTAVTF